MKVVLKEAAQDLCCSRKVLGPVNICSFEPCRDDVQEAGQVTFDVVS